MKPLNLRRAILRIDMHRNHDLVVQHLTLNTPYLDIDELVQLRNDLCALRSNFFGLQKTILIAVNVLKNADRHSNQQDGFVFN